MAPSQKTLAVLALATAVTIYGGQFVGARFGIKTDLSAFDVAALRVAVPFFVFLPFFVRLGVRDCAGVGWGRGLILATLGGAPLATFSALGLAFAPAAHGSAIQPGMVAVAATALGYWSARERMPAGVAAGFGLAVLGLGAIAAAGSTGAEGPSVLIGDLLFFVCGTGWGTYTWLCSRWQVPAVASAASVSVLSGPFLPLYWFFLEPGLLSASPWSVAFHAFYQGLLVVVVGLLLWTYGARTLGARLAGRFPPMIPVIGTIVGAIALAEIPTPLALGGVAAVVAGLIVAALARR